MANLKEKYTDLRDVVTSLLGYNITTAEKLDTYKAWTEALEAVRVIEDKTKAVRSHVRAKMRKALAELQAVCKHEKRHPGATRFDFETKISTPMEEFCDDCKLRFDLRQPSK